MEQVNIKSSGGGISTNTGMVVVHNHTIVNLNNDLLKIISEQHKVINHSSLCCLLWLYCMLSILWKNSKDFMA